MAGEAIRSVTHLVLAPVGPMSWLNPNSNRKERTRRLLPGSLRLGFLGQPFYYHRRPLWQAPACTDPAPIPPPAGPENVQCRAVFIQYPRVVVPAARLRAAGPTRFRLTARSNRLQNCFSATVCKVREQPLPISSQGSMSNPFHWLTATLINLALHDSRGAPPPPISSLAQCPTLALAGGDAHKITSAGWPAPEISGGRRSRFAGS